MACFNPDLTTGAALQCVTGAGNIGLGAIAFVGAVLIAAAIAAFMTRAEG